MKKKLSAKKLVLVLIVLILLPAIFLTANEFNSLNSSEKMLTQIYNRQLEAILFSVNQFAWDAVNNWASKINLFLKEDSKNTEKSFLEFLNKNQAIHAIFITDSLINQISTFSIENPSIFSLKQQIRKTLQPRTSAIARLYRFKKTGYQKIEPFSFQDDGQEQFEIVLVFVPDELRDGGQFVGLLLNTEQFIQNVISLKLREIAGDDLIVGVFHQEIQEPVFSTDEILLKDVKLKKAVWFFPDYFLGIRLKGQTIEELARSRFYRNLFFIIILDAILLGAIGFVYRSISKEIELAQMKSDFVSNVSHELKTPLSLIRMFSETLEMNRVSSEQKKQEYYRVISQETERLTHLVNNILNFSRMEAGRKEYNFQSIELNELVKKVLENYDFHLRQNGFGVKLQLGENLPSINADEESLSEALLNLIDNAIKYSNKEKFIGLKTGMDNGSVFLEVEDHGIGIDMAQKERIFDKFYRVSGGLVHNSKGSGLGLTLVKNIIDAHGGKITVDSHPGKGSRFKLYLPIESQEPRPKGQEANDQSQRTYL